MKKITWGIIGAGYIANSFAQALSKSKDSICLAVASCSKERGSAFATKWGFQRVYNKYEDLIADKAIDAIYIATPHVNHAELSISALKAGKSVLCEKPAAINAKELCDIYDCAKKNGCFFMEALWTKFQPVFQKVLCWVKDGKIGEVQGVYADFCINLPEEPKYSDLYKTSRLFDPNLAGGALLDVGIYPVVFALSVVEAYLQNNMEDKTEKNLLPQKISAVARMSSSNVDLFDSISIKFDKIVATLSCALDMECGSDLKNAKIIGSKGKIEVPLFWMAQEAFLYNGKGEVVEHIKLPFEINGYEYEIKEFCDCLNRRLDGEQVDESSFHTYAQNLRVMKVLDGIRSNINLIYPFECANRVIREETQVFNQSKILSDSKMNNESIIVYTDGGCSGNPGPGGWGCVILYDGVQYSTSGGEPLTTNNRMELSAAIAALSAIDQNDDWNKKHVLVHIDSQYVKNGITSWIKSWKKNGWKNSEKQPVKNRDLWEILDSLNSKLNVEWQWVKGHAGIEYNELCDKLATQEVEKYSK